MTKFIVLSEENYAKLEDRCRELGYFSDCNIRFKKCDIYVVILRKHINTQTNEMRQDINDDIYATYRANSLYVVDIINVDTLEHIDRIINTSFNAKTVYIKGHIVNCDNYDSNINEVCSGGIHYFKSLKVTYYHNAGFIDNFYSYIVNGLFTSWYDSGQKKQECTLRYGVFEGTETWWYESGQKECECTYKNGNREGIEIGWYNSGLKRYICVYNCDKLDGVKIQWYESGQKKYECTYKNGNLEGVETEWYESGQKMYECTYKNGNLEGMETVWYEPLQTVLI